MTQTNARRDAAQDLGLGPDAEGEEDHGQHEERDHRRRIAALPQRQPQIARHQPAESDHPTSPRLEIGERKRRRRRQWAAAHGSTTRCGHLPRDAPRSPRPASPIASASRPLMGSSRSQSGAALAMSRASARRRRWPADSSRHGQSARPAEAEALERRRDIARPPHPGPEPEHLRGGQPRLERVLMADEMEARPMRARILGDRAAVPGEAARFGRRQPGHQPQQARLAAAIGAGEQQSLSGGNGEIEPGKDQPLAAPAGEAASGKGRRRNAESDGGGMRSGRAKSAGSCHESGPAQRKTASEGGQPRPSEEAVGGGPLQRCETRNHPISHPGVYINKRMRH